MVTDHTGESDMVEALDTVAARLRLVRLDDEEEACRELTDIVSAVRVIVNAVTP
jgi:hypothetical protein